jgi:hypothetical protein
MKKIILLAVALVSLATITSCSKDDDSASLQGKWVFFKTGTLVNGQEVLEDVVPDSDGCQQDYIQITATNIISHDFDDLGSGCEEFIGESDPYTRKGNIITSNGQTSEIKSLTGSTLKIYSVYDLDGTTETDIIVFKRI